MKQHDINILDLRNQFDKHNMFESILSFPSQIRDSFSITEKYFKENKEKFEQIHKNINSILICGMGGSAIGAELARTISFKTIKTPIIINRSNIIPNWVNDNTLVIVSSYSGNTYEIIEAFNKVKEKTSKIIAISSSSGLLNDYCLKHNFIIFNLPSGFQPRCTLGYASSIILFCTKPARPV